MKMICTLIVASISILSFGQTYKGYLVPYRKVNKWGYSDTNKVIIIKPIFDAAFFFEGSMANVILKGVGGHIDSNGKFVKGYLYQGRITYHQRPLTPDNKKAKRFEAFKEQYDSLKYFDEYKRKVYKNGKCGVIGTENNVLLKIEYDTIKAAGNNMYIIVKDGKYGFVDGSFKYIVPVQYDFVDKFNDQGYVFIMLNKRGGVVNKSNIRFFKD